MTYVWLEETWHAETKVSMKPRSSRLKAIDKALANYHKAKTEENLKKLRLALHQWKMFKGYDAAAGKPAWRTSIRNHRKAIETLDAQLFGVQTPFERSVLADMADLPFYGVEAWADDTEAKAILKEARLQALPLLFMGKKVKLKEWEVQAIGRDIKKSISKTKKKASEAQSAVTGAAVDAATAPARSAARQTLQPAEQAARQIIAEVTAVFPEVAVELTKLLAEIVPTFIVDVAAAVAPYISLAPSAGKAVKNTVQATLAEYKWIKARGHIESFGPGDPVAAAMCITRIIERKRNQHARLAAIYTTDVTVKAAAIGCDAASLGIPSVSAVVTPLQGFATALANLSLKIFLLARDMYEVKQANKILKAHSSIQITSKLFDECPLMGCYFVACSTHSDILNFLVEDMGAPGWQTEVEVMMSRHIEPMIKNARSMIGESKYVVSGLEMSKGVVDDVSPGMKNIKNRLKKTAVAKIKSAIPHREQA